MKEKSSNLIIQNEKILLINRKNEDIWQLPGGSLRGDESPTETAINHASDQLGVEIKLVKPFYSGEFQYNDDIILWHCYLSEIVEGEINLETKMCDKYQWFQPEKLDELSLTPGLELIMPAIRKLSKKK